jgi:hypothetical protein
MAATTYNKIGISHEFGREWTYVERVAAAGSTVYPGDLVERTTADTMQEHSTADGFAEGLVADINPYEEDTSTAAIDKVWAVGDTVRMIQSAPGDTLNMRLATSQTAVINSPLVSNGDGTLKVATIGAGTLEGAVRFMAIEAVTTTSSVARILVKRV